MARDWSIEGRYVEYCSCDMGCPCESMAPPTNGYCTGAVAFQVDKGHCEAISLDGLKVVATFYFPRAIHHGAGHMQPILENTISDQQKDAIFYILSGQDQPAGTMFQIFSVIVEKLHDPIHEDRVRVGHQEARGPYRGAGTASRAKRAHSEPGHGQGTPDDQCVTRRLGLP